MEHLKKKDENLQNGNKLNRRLIQQLYNNTKSRKKQIVQIKKLSLLFSVTVSLSWLFQRKTKSIVMNMHLVTSHKMERK